MNFITANIGNTHTTLALFAKRRFVAKRTLKTRDLSASLIKKSVMHLIKNRPIDAVLVCGVVPKAERLLRAQILRMALADIFVAGKNLPIPMKSRYHQPSKLGIDRLVGAYEAYQKSRKAVIVIDAGTAVTIDAVSAHGIFLGGAIAPGSAMMSECLSAKTAQIPRTSLSQKTPSGPFGRSTRESLLIASTHGLAGLVGSIVEKMRRLMRVDPALVCTGGFAGPLSRLMGRRYAVKPFLIEHGLIDLYLSAVKKNH